jgi:phage head maturation protease
VRAAFRGAYWNDTGTLSDAWIAGGALVGRLKFAQTERGELAEGRVARGELNAVSVGYRVTKWGVADANGNAVDPERDHIAWDDDDLTFTATRWQLFEVSLVGVPADGAALVNRLRRFEKYLCSHAGASTHRRAHGETWQFVRAPAKATTPVCGHRQPAVLA